MAQASPIKRVTLGPFGTSVLVAVLLLGVLVVAALQRSEKISRGVLRAQDGVVHAVRIRPLPWYEWRRTVTVSPSVTPVKYRHTESEKQRAHERWCRSLKVLMWRVRSTTGKSARIVAGRDLDIQEFFRKARSGETLEHKWGRWDKPAGFDSYSDELNAFFTLLAFAIPTAIGIHQKKKASRPTH